MIWDVRGFKALKNDSIVLQSQQTKFDDQTYIIHKQCKYFNVYFTVTRSSLNSNFKHRDFEWNLIQRISKTLRRRDSILLFCFADHSVECFCSLYKQDGKFQEKFDIKKQHSHCEAEANKQPSNQEFVYTLHTFVNIISKLPLISIALNHAKTLKHRNKTQAKNYSTAWKFRPVSLRLKCGGGKTKLSLCERQNTISTSTLLKALSHFKNFAVDGAKH